VGSRPDDGASGGVGAPPSPSFLLLRRDRRCCSFSTMLPRSPTEKSGAAGIPVPGLPSASTANVAQLRDDPRKPKISNAFVPIDAPPSPRRLRRAETNKIRGSFPFGLEPRCGF
jgi:hypothetical protein